MTRPNLHKGLSRPHRSAAGWLICFWLPLLFWMCAGPATFSWGQDQARPEKKQASPHADVQTDLVTQKILYHAPGAEEVYLVWGINGLQPVPETFRPPNTYLDNKNVMRTHLIRAGDTFTVNLRIPRGSRLDYTFMVATKKEAGGKDVWRSEADSAGRPFTKEVKSDGRIEVKSKMHFASDDLQGDLVTQELRYFAPGADEVYLAWGINGRQPVAEEIRPPGTYLDDNKVMRTQLVRAGDTFSTTLRIPRGSRLDYHFVLAIKKGGGTPDIWRNEMDYGYHPFVKEVTCGGRIETQSTVTPRPPAVTAEQRKAWLAGETTDIPLVTQEILYHAPGAGEVWLVWGLEGWHAVPAAARPPSTVLTDYGGMHTRMVRKTGDTFALQLKVPAGMRLNHKFLLTKTDAEAPIHFIDDASGRSRFTVRTDSLLNVEPTTNPVTKELLESWLTGKTSEIPLVAQELSFTDRSMLLEHLQILWGIDGWQTLPATARPPGAVLVNGLMLMPMVRKGGTFTAKVMVPPGTSINYEYLLDKPPVSASPDNGSANLLVGQLDGRLEVESGATKIVLEQHKSWPSGPLDPASLITQAIRYRIAGADEVWLVWGINGWQLVPEEVRPPGTILKDNKVMHTPLIKNGDTFMTTVRVPTGTVLNYNFLITKTSRGAPVSIWQDFNGQDFGKVVRASGSSEEKATVTVVTPEQRKAWLDGQAADLPLVTQEIRYHAPGAAEVWLAWGLEGWQTIPDAARPLRTVLKNGMMHTHMVREGNTFTTTVRVPPGTVLDFSFLIAKTEEGKVVDIRQAKEGNGRELSRTVAFDGQIEVRSTAWLASPTTDLLLVEQAIRYRIAGAEEVWLVWGINGWQAIPEAARPAGTVLKDNRVMHTHMIRKGDTFVATVRVPPGTKLDYKFLITKTSRGAPVNIWQNDDGQDFQRLVRVGGSLEEKATVSVVTPEQRKAWLDGQAADLLPLVTQEIHYRAPGAAEVWLAWGLEGWQAIPELVRPPGTVVKNGTMHTRMVREGTRFTATVRVPPGTALDFSFLITKTEEGSVVAIRQEKDEEGRAFTKVVMFDGQLEVLSQWEKAPS